MKRHGNLFQKIISIENLMLADEKARKGKSRQPAIARHDKNRQQNILKIHHLLSNKQYVTSSYATFTIYEPKERIVYRLPYIDRIVQHAIVRVLEPIWVASFTRDTYSCIKKRGVHSASNALRKALKNKKDTTYCLKLDVKKFYPNVDHAILKKILRKKIKDQDLLWLLDGIIDSAEGLPIGNYLSQFLANLYLTYFDHFIKEVLRVKYYFRYCDDLVFLAQSKVYLHWLLFQVRKYLGEELKLSIKKNYQVFPVAIRGIDFCGYPTFPDHVLIRKSIKMKFIKMLRMNPNAQSVASYMGWLKHCNSKHLLTQLMKKFSELNIQVRKYFRGPRVDLRMLVNNDISINRFKFRQSKKKGVYLVLDIDFKEKNYVVFTGAEYLMDIMREVKREDLPFRAAVKMDEYKTLEFTDPASYAA
jgi:RNA-directed DNA polymerase